MFPGLATAQTLLGRGHEVTLLIGGKRIEASTRQAWTGPVVVVPAEGLSAHPVRLPRSLLVLARVYRQCLREFERNRPDALLAMGSYSSVGPVLAARRLRIPVVLHEANVIPGRAIECLSRFAAVVAISFEETRGYLRHPHLELTGIPLRCELAAAAQTMAAPPVFTVLVMGGSQGAQRLNQTVPAAVARLAHAGQTVRVIHLAGERDRATVASAYGTSGIAGVVHGFLADMASAYRESSVAICRSGAASCAELALFGIPAILVPYPEAARNHQRANALALQSAQAALLLDQAELTPERLGDALLSLAADPARRAAMRQAALARALPGADRNLAVLVERAAASR
jgi:UDP-N-acetylglucosamine--N-acetylmuramyl-(pentapeptide) pyrophosphoryl-undecaprenol N-acetylglucosamine transferase